MKALWWVLALSAACGGEKSRSALPLDVKATYAVEGDLERMDVSIHTIPSATVSATIGTTQPVVATADAKGDAQLRVPISPVEKGELELVVKGYQPPGKQLYVPAVQTSRVKRTPILAISADGTGLCRIKTCSVYVTPKGHIEMRDLVDVTSVLIDGANATVKNGLADHAMDVEGLASRVSIVELFERRDARGGDGPLKLPIEIAWGDGVTIKGSLPIPWYPLREAVVAMLSAAGPIKLRDPGTGRGVLRTDPPSISPDVTKLGDIGIVVRYGEVQRTQECGTYRNEKGETAKFMMFLRDTVVSINELSTGKTLGERTFLTPKSPCPKITTGAMAEASYQRGDTDKKWVDSILKR